MFIFSRISSQHNLPLISRLFIRPVSAGLNGTVVNCVEIETSNYSSTTILILGDTINSNLSVGIQSKQFESDGVVVILNWNYSTPQTYHNNVSIYVVPDLLDITFSGNKSIQLILPYNIHHNVSIIPSPCGDNISDATFFELDYAKCCNPVALLQDDDVIAMGYKDPALEGTNIIFSCLPGFTLAGSNKSTCTGNGQWEPNVTELECKANCNPPTPLGRNSYIIPYSSTLEGSEVTIVCQTNEVQSELELNFTTIVCNEYGNWEPNPSNLCTLISDTSSTIVTKCDTLIKAVTASVGVFISSSILFFLIGCFCGRFSEREKSPSNSQPSDDEATHSHSPHQSVLYEGILPALAHQETNLALSTTALASSDLETRLEDDLELKENLAYGPLKSTFEV